MHVTLKAVTDGKPCGPAWVPALHDSGSRPAWFAVLTSRAVSISSLSVERSICIHTQRTACPARSAPKSSPLRLTGGASRCTSHITTTLSFPYVSGAYHHTPLLPNSDLRGLVVLSVGRCASCQLQVRVVHGLACHGRELQVPKARAAEHAGLTEEEGGAG